MRHYNPGHYGCFTESSKLWEKGGKCLTAGYCNIDHSLGRAVVEGEEKNLKNN